MNIKEIYETEIKKLVDTVDKFPWEDKDAYALFLKQAFAWVRESSPLLSIAGARLERYPEIKMNARFQAHFMKTAMEELGHELDCRRDLEFLGFEFDSVPLLGSTKSMFATAYYVVQNENPLTHYGYVLMLEGIAVERASMIAEKVSGHFGGAGKFLQLHGDEDPAHLSGVFKTLELIEPEHMPAIIENFCHSCNNFQLVLEEVMREFRTPDLRVAG